MAEPANGARATYVYCVNDANDLIVLPGGAIIVYHPTLSNCQAAAAAAWVRDVTNRWCTQYNDWLSQMCLFQDFVQLRVCGRA